MSHFTHIHPRSAARVPLLVVLALLPGCHEVTEYSSAGEIGVVVVDLEGLTVEGVIEGFDGGRAILSVGEDAFIVSSNRGRLFVGDSEARTIENVFQIGTPFGSGYCSIVPGSSSVYVLGGFGSILEFSLATHTVVDEFQAGPLPMNLCRAGFAQYVYVADGQDGIVREVWISDNEVHEEFDLSVPIGSITTSELSGSDPLVLATAVSDDSAFIMRPGHPYYHSTVFLPSPAVDACALPDSAVFFLAHPDIDGNGGVTKVSVSELSTETSVWPLEGEACLTCVDPMFGRLYVACRIPGGTTRIYEMSIPAGMAILRTLEVDGSPRDMVIQGVDAGRLLLLTTG